MKIAIPATIVTVLLTFSVMGDTRAAVALIAVMLMSTVVCIAVWLRLGPAEQPAAPPEPRVASTHDLYQLRNGRCPVCGGSDFLVSSVIEPMVRLQCGNKHVWFVRFDNHEIEHAVQMGDAT